ncbi:MAG: hypothetical protein KJ957_07970 [Candidatus Omnitrophica bacterium]|nr:hypothetical protein [Candidatus Omnitrophota bacterium]
MIRRKLVNLTFVGDKYFNPFEVNGYTFYSQNPQHQQGARIRVYTSTQALRDNRRHKQNAYVEYAGAPEASILFRGGRVGVGYHNDRERKILEDLLVLGSVLTPQNWQLFSRRDFPQYPVISRNHLEYISKDAKKCKQYLDVAITKLKDASWQKQFENGFHLLMLLNHANILNSESRFLSMVVIWEWLYPHLKNPNGATPNDESNNLLEVFSFILKQFWPAQFNNSFRKSNIFHMLRNQLAHSGKLPINRTKAEPWMTKILWDYKDTTKGISDYLEFFDHLTQIVVLKTIGIDGEDSLKVFNFPEQLNSFLTMGRI